MLALCEAYGGEASGGEEDAEPVRKRSRHAPPALSPAPPPLATDPHEGRVRTFPHVVGNFAVAVFVPLPPPPLEAQAELAAALAALSARLAPAAQLRPLPLDSLHLSLSAPCAVRRHQAPPLYAALRARLRRSSPPPPAHARLGGQPLALLNEAGTRTFLALPLGGAQAAAGLAAAVAAVDAALAGQGLPPLRPPGADAYLPHASVAWALGDAREAVREACSEVAALAALRWAAPLARVQLRVGKVEASCWGEGEAVDGALRFRGY